MRLILTDSLSYACRSVGGTAPYRPITADLQQAAVATTSNLHGTRGG